MTVSSLWKALDMAGSGTLVGGKEFTFEVTTPLKRTNIRALAVDLSIWICESLTSQEMSENHANPALHLVFTRTMRLLTLGIKLIVVIEGKRRYRCAEGKESKFRKRRSGTAFWNACRDCQRLLEMIGVPVVRAKAEGEALCALLNQREVVDGVISNDGDCLLFGATTVFTNFSLESLRSSQVARYDAGSLFAIASTNDSEPDERVQDGDRVKFSRHDLISFALLTGSDLAGEGFRKVGHKKAVRFINKCKLDNPLQKETASLDEMQSWARAASADVSCVHMQLSNKEVCSRCCHKGSKRDHIKHGCEICGTGPGEPCFEETSDDRFRQSLRSKALSMRPKFEPSQVLRAYMRPNDNQIPIQLAGISSGSLKMSPPLLQDLACMNLIVKGHHLESSREYVLQNVMRLLAHSEMMHSDGDHPDRALAAVQCAREKPIPQRIKRALIQNFIPCYEIEWQVNATVTNQDGVGVDGYGFVTIEPRDLVQRSFPTLVTAFQETEKERSKQGESEQVRRQLFLRSFLAPTHDAHGEHEEENVMVKIDRLPFKGKRKAAYMQKRLDFFQGHAGAKVVDMARAATTKMMADMEHDDDMGEEMMGEDVLNLLGPRRGVLRASKMMRLTPSSSLSSDLVGLDESSSHPKSRIYTPMRVTQRARDRDPHLPSLTSAEPLYCDMGRILIAVTPVVSHRGVYPPRHIFVRKSVTPEGSSPPHRHLRRTSQKKPPPRPRDEHASRPPPASPDHGSPARGFPVAACYHGRRC